MTQAIPIWWKSEAPMNALSVEQAMALVEIRQVLRSIGMAVDGIEDGEIAAFLRDHMGNLVDWLGSAYVCSRPFLDAVAQVARINSVPQTVAG